MEDKMLRTLTISLLFVIFFTYNALAADVIIVNKNNPSVNISSSNLKTIYNGNDKLWADGKNVAPVDLIDSQPSAVKFAKTILGVDMETKRRFWIEKIFAGAGTPPHQEKDDKGVISYVASEPGAIGYVDKNSVTSAVKSVTIDGKGEF